MRRAGCSDRAQRSRRSTGGSSAGRAGEVGRRRRTRQPVAAGSAQRLRPDAGPKPAWLSLGLGAGAADLAAPRSVPSSPAMATGIGAPASARRSQATRARSVAGARVPPPLPRATIRAGTARAGPTFAEEDRRRARARDLLLRPPRPGPVLQVLHATIFPRQVKDYEEKFGIRFIGWYNVAHGWDFDNVILLDLPDYATLDKLEKDEAHAGTRPSGRRMDLRTPPLDVPARADGARSRVPPVDSPTDGGDAMDRAATTCSASSRPTPPSSAPISSSRRPSSCASSSTPTASGSRRSAA